MENQKICVEIFKNLHKKYKKIIDISANEQNLAETCTPDYYLFQKLIKYFEILDELLKYVVLKNEEYYSSVKRNFNEVSNLSVNIPRSLHELATLYETYPKAIDEINEELFEIINMENFEGLLILRKINILLYYSIVDEKLMEKIMTFEDDIKQFEILVEIIIKKLLREYIKMSISVAKKQKNREPSN